MGVNPKKYRALRWVDLDQLIVDPAYQRDPSPTWVAAKAKKFNMDLFDPAAASQREDGTYALIDGQGRLGLARAVGMESMPCLVYTGLTREQESELFRLFQSERRQLRPWDEFKASLHEQLPWAVQCNEAAHAHGFEIGQHGDKGQSVVITAVRVLQRIIDADEEGGTVLDTTLHTLSQAWGVAVPMRVDASVIEGLGAFVAAHDGRYDEDRLLQILSGEGSPQPPLDPEKIRGRAAAARARSAGKFGVAADGMFSRRWSVLTVLEKAYNDSITAEGTRVGLLRKTRRPRDEARAKRQRARAVATAA